MKINFNSAMPGKAVIGILFYVVCLLGQVIVYQPNETRYLLTGSWAIGSNLVSTVTRNDSVVQWILPAGAGQVPESLSVESKITPSEGGFSIDMVAPNPWFDCVVYREFNRETSRFAYTAGSNSPRTIFEDERTVEESLFESKTENRRVGVSFAWAPDGKSAVCITGKKIQVLTYKPSNASFTVNKTIAFEGDGLFSPAWYDTSIVLFVQSRNVQMLDIASGKINTLRIEGGIKNAYYYDISVSFARPEFCMVVCAPTASDNLQLWLGKFISLHL